MANDPVLEQALLEHLRFAPLSRAELVRRTGASDQRVQAALNELVAETYVARRPQDGGPADYELTAAGSGRLDMLEDLKRAPFKTIGRVLAAGIVDLKDLPPPSEPRKLLLSDDDRSVCSAALAAQFALGRIDKDELARRTDLLFAARVRAELDVIFEGLPPPALADPTTGPQTWPASWGVHGWILLVALMVAGMFAITVVLSHPTVPTLVLLLVAIGAGFAWRLVRRRR